MVLILVESIASMIGKFCSTFILSNEMEKAESTTKLSKLDVTDKKNIHNREFEVSFAIKHDILALMKVGKISDSQVYKIKFKIFKIFKNRFFSGLNPLLLTSN